MSRVVEFVVDMLPLDLPGRRAVDETLADWRHEAGETRTASERAVVAVRGVTATVGTLCRVTIAEAGTPQTWTLFGRVMALALLFSVLMIVRTASSTLERVGASTAILLFLTLLPSAMASCLPLALLTPPFNVRRGVPVLGLSALLLVLGVANLGWLTPVANTSFREAAFRSQAVLGRQSRTSPSAVSPPARGTAERSLAELIERSRFSGLDGIRAAQALSDRLAIITFAPVALLLGVQSRRLAHSRGWRFGAGALAWAIGAAAAIPVVVAVIEVRGLLRSHFYPADELRFLQYWVSPLFVISVCGVMARLARGASRRCET